MTIGDEKVVQRWTPEICEDEQDGQIVAGMDPYTEGHYVLHSAYAELAAERDALDDRCVMLHGFAEHMRRRAESAESQLAELRGKVVGLAEHYDWLFQTEQDDEISGRHIADELRTLAAADGGGG